MGNRYSQIAFLIAALVASPILLAACADGTDTSVKVQWDVLVPVHDYLYLGENLPECTDAEANMVAYGHDHALKICTGGKHGHGWQPLVIE